MKDLRVLFRWLGGALALAGLAAILAGLARREVVGLFSGDLALGVLGWGAFVELLVSFGVAGLYDTVHAAIVSTLPKVKSSGLENLEIWAGLGLWVVGWGLLSQGFTGPEAAASPPSAAVGTPLHPRIAQYRDFHWGTLAAYGLGFLLAEVAMLGLFVLLVGKGAQAGAEGGGLGHVTAFLIAFGLGLLLAALGGFLGAAHSGRLSTPEATIAILYFGLPVPIVLSLMTQVGWLMLHVGVHLREVAYLSAQLGENRPELGYWLVFGALALALVLGLNLGFVATSSGRLDLKLTYESFIANRHVQVFRPRLLLSIFAVLILGIVPPLVLYLIVMAAEQVVERTRIRHLGLKDPLLASEALHALKKRGQTPTAMMTTLSVGGVGVGVMALIIVLSVMSGFELDLQSKILGTNSHGVVLKYGDAMPEWREVMDKIAPVKGLAGQTPFVLNEVMISSDGNISGSMIKGIDPESVGTVTDLPKYLKRDGLDCPSCGKLEWLTTPEKIVRARLTPMGEPMLDEKGGAAVDWPKPERKSGLEDDPLIEAPKPDATKVLPGILLGKELALSLKVQVGDRVNVVSPLGGELGPQGPMPKSRPFKVAGIFYSGMYEYDSKFVYIDLHQAMDFFNLKGPTGLELKFEDVDNARRLTRQIYDLLEGYPYRTRDWGEMNKNLFAALRLEKLVMGIILSVIVIVAAGLIVATVIMLVLEKRKEIAVLKALGVSDGGVVKIFLTEGLQIGIAGGLLGLVAGLGWCLFIEKVGIKLDPQVYYIPALPVRIEAFQTVLSVVVAVLITFLASIYPALEASQVEPVEGLKSE
ncbi:MAG: ABC transporter permease [Myxococcaceae bacterium]|nr:ABC transporter permease [Myxococcaceae bacterium]